MSKTKNRKRARLLHQRKKERIKQASITEMIEKDRQMLIQNAEKFDVKVVDRSVAGNKEKISTVLLEMIKPMLATAKSNSEIKGMIFMGVLAWNCGIIKQNLGDEKLNEAINSFFNLENELEKMLLKELINYKCTEYVQYNDYIIDYQLSFGSNGSMGFSVITGGLFNAIKMLKK